MEASLIYCVDAADWQTFAACGTGPGVPYDPGSLPAASGCGLWPGADNKIVADFDTDGDVDQGDFSILQRCYGGAGSVATDCAN